MGERAQIRELHRVKRGQMRMDQVQQASEQISQFLAKDMKIWNAPCIYAYYPCHQEASILPFVRRMLEKGKKLAFPRVKGEEMEFYAVEDMDAFQKGSFGIMEPIGQKPVCEEQAVVLVPGLVFDENGNRMGYGKGYYDRYFHSHKVQTRIGIAYEHQMEKEIIPQSWDVPMDGIVTEKGVRWTHRI